MIKTALVTPDKHFPIHCPKALKVLLKCITMAKIDIYIDLGDTGEWELFSNHHWKEVEKPPPHILNPMRKKQVKVVNKYMDMIDDALDKVGCKERHFLQGNHEVWLDNVAKREDRPEYFTKTALKIEERGYKYYPYNQREVLEIGKMLFTHGKYTVTYHSAKHVNTYGKNIMYGHTHDLQRHTITKYKKTWSAWSMGCLKDITKDEDWLKGKPVNWNHGFALVHFFKDGTFIVEVIEIVDGKTVFRGVPVKWN
jgi:hypothetical protein|tara:strand:- start:750 stop:1508 length:759 start_codon:yes stop_codon:yes gene_type:complete